MKRIYYPYYEWEDYLNGMYDTQCELFDDKVNKAYLILKDSELFFNLAVEMTSSWVLSTAVNLSNVSCNRRAWIGQATCSFSDKCTELSTRAAWAMLTEIEKYKANAKADIIIKSYEERNKSLYKNMGAKMLF